MNAWLAQHRKALRWALHRLTVTPLNTLLSLLAIGIAMALPAGGQMLLGNALQFARSANATPQVSLFMQIDAERKASNGIAARLAKHPGVRETHFISREEALKRMQADASLAEVIAALPKNPFPDAFVITPQSDRPEALEQLRDELKTWPNVEHVQLDSAWVRRLDALLRFGRTAVTLLATLLGVGLVAITFTTIRLQILTQRAEIEVSRLLGATDGFIRRPFYYFGVMQGLAGGIVAWLIVFGITALLATPVADIAAIYNTTLSLHSLSTEDSLILLALAAILGWLGSALSLGRYLRGS